MILSREVKDDYEVLMMASAMAFYDYRIASVYPYRSRLIVLGQHNTSEDDHLINLVDKKFEELMGWNYDE